MVTPKWMISHEDIVLPSALPENPGRVKPSFLEKTLCEIASVLQESVFSEAFAHAPGLLQGLDPRVKFAALLLFLIVASLVHSIPVLLAIYLMTLLLAWLSSIGLPFFIKRVWLFIPLFAGIMAIPALFNVITPGEAWIPFFHLSRPYSWGPYHIPQVVGISREGALGALVFVCRVAASVSLVVLVTLSTPWTYLLKALRVVRVPQIFVLTLGMTYRYILLLVKLVQEMYWAKRSRTIRFSRLRAEQGWIASRMGVLFRKSFQLSQEIHGAMCSRGFDGEIRTLQTFRMRARDGIAIMGAVLVSTLFFWWDRWLS